VQGLRKACASVQNAAEARRAVWCKAGRGFYIHFAACPAAKAQHEAEKAAEKAAIVQAHLFLDEPF
jgi:hypothetical protein